MRSFLIFIFLPFILSGQTNNFRYYPQQLPLNVTLIGPCEFRTPQKTADKGYIFSFFPWAQGLHTYSAYDTYTIKTDSNFVPQWRKPFYAKSIVLPTGGVILIYNTMIANSLYNGVNIEKITQSGIQVWTKNFTSENIVLNDGVTYTNKVRFVGRKRGNTGWPSFSETSQAYTLEIDTNGNFLSHSLFNNSYLGDADMSGIKRDASGNFFVYSEMDPSSVSMMVLAKFTSSFTPVWAKRYTSINDPLYIEDIDVLPNGRIMASAMLRGASQQWNNATIIKFDSQGNIVTQKFLDKSHAISGLTKKANGNYIISAVRGNFQTDSMHTFEIDTSMNIIWNRYRSRGYGVATSIIKYNNLYTAVYDGVRPFLVHSDSSGFNCSSFSRSYSLLTPTMQIVSFTFTPVTSLAGIVTGTLNVLQSQSYSDTCRCTSFLISNAAASQICTASTTTLLVTGTGALSWYATATGSTFISSGPTFTYSSTTPTIMTVFAQDSTCLSPNRVPVTVTVSAPPSLTLTPTTTSICSGSSVTIIASGANTYSWSNSSQSSSIIVSPASSTNYTVTGFAGLGCFATMTKSVSVVPMPTLSIGTNTSAACAGGGTLSIFATGATNYLWSTSQTGSSIIYSPFGGLNNIQVTGSNANCTATAQAVVLGILGAPSLTVNASPTSVCPGQPVILTVSGATTYTWNNQFVGSSYTATPLVNTVYNVTGSNGNSCTSTRTVLVNALPTPTLSFSNNAPVVCAGISLTLGVTGASTYTWSNAANTPVITLAPTAPTNYSVIGTAANSCTAAANILVNTSPLPFIFVNASQTSICPSQTVMLNAIGATTYTWNQSVFSSTAIVAPHQSATYTVYATSSNGCIGTSTITVTVNPLPTITVNNATVCAGNSYTIIPSGAATYTFSGGSNVVSPASTTVYTISGSNSLGCAGVSPGVFTLSTIQSPTLSVSTSSSVICIGESATISATGANSYQWNTGASGSSIVILPTLIVNSFTVTGTLANGCSSTGVFSQNVQLCTSLMEKESAAGILIYPNPNSGNFTIYHSRSEGVIYLYDLLGKQLMYTKIFDGANRLNITELPAGIYLLTVKYGDNQQSLRLIKE